MKDIINRIAELRKNIETAKTTDVIEISVELIRIESLLKQLTLTDVVDCKHDNEIMRQGDGFVYSTCGDCGDEL